MEASRAHSIFMQRCLDLAANGQGQTAPNPMVGCVVVHRGQVLGEGYHQAFGQPHAEVNAIAAVENKELLRESVLYVNLEPCSHHGKTPPCSQLILRSGIQQVVVGATDPNPLVDGQGISELRRNGCLVVEGVMEDACRQLNKRFYTYHREKRPYVVLKWAETADGFIDIRPRPDNHLRPTWISSEKMRQLVHKWRSEEMAIMVGRRTAARDNPRLNVREWPGRQPMRLVVDQQLQLPAGLHLFDGQQPTLIFNTLRDDSQGHTRWVRLPLHHMGLQPIMDYLYEQHVQSVFVEGGQVLLQSFINQGLWDEARVFRGVQSFGMGIKAPVLDLSPAQSMRIGEEELIWFVRNGQGQAEPR